MIFNTKILYFPAGIPHVFIETLSSHKGVYLLACTHGCLRLWQHGLAWGSSRGQGAALGAPPASSPRQTAAGAWLPVPLPLLAAAVKQTIAAGGAEASVTRRLPAEELDAQGRLPRARGVGSSRGRQCTAVPGSNLAPRPLGMGSDWPTAAHPEHLAQPRAGGR